MVYAVVVAYNPDLSDFATLLHSLACQVDVTVIVDNSPAENDSVFSVVESSGLDVDRLAIVRLGANRGVAYAINIGFDIALGSGAEYVLLSDQDSLPAAGMVKQLQYSFIKLLAKGCRVAAVGPTFIDTHTQRVCPFQASMPNKFFYGHTFATADEPEVEALSLITSGSLIKASAIGEIGPMREDFFIDRVDTEWCLRAQSLGYKVYGTTATMYQQLGESSFPVWWFGWRHETKYAPIRIYYQIRNSTFMWRLGFVSWRWKVRNSWYALGVLYAQAFYGPDKKESCRLGLLGLWDGIVGRMGPMRSSRDGRRGIIRAVFGRQ